MKNTADESAVKEAGENERRKRQRELADLATILGGAEGQRFIKRLLDYCGVSKSSFRLTDRQEAYVVGALDVGNFVLKEVAQAAPAIGAQIFVETYAEKKGNE